ncbi:hypothetical protein DCO58_05530 [Helicobacter saguini]|uniref:Uncharacterized protein n=1 Tax=Helicobacter saguini TaxID=1548018 RepID=A0A347VT95_9HELI|nr:hypothetical protein [Helicobacter saguini]MWV62188.1 hypothetical protein [Helicobacter saguini]MWV67138.1 hypothetical protein [Helicobacter saguini]MWV69490.1 hypothetical protein [Helicobacter saguini]MWV70958.1 hypothetical protein [Helicobacter saguini]TLD92954.1 hypothetical protein LS64_009710 [Helicobacter saguini]
MKDILYEVHYYDKDSANIIDNFLNLENNHGDIKLIKINDDMLDSTHKDSPTYLLLSLYTCKSFAICSKDNKSLIDKNNTEKILGYKSVFANIFILNKDSITNEYLESRKELYKSFMTLKQERVESIE